LSGTAHIEYDRAKMEELYTPWVKFWHSQGLDDPDAALLCVEIEKAEYWAAPYGAVRRTVALTKALTTGDKRVIGDNERSRCDP
jgi:general stress protein 26